MLKESKYNGKIKFEKILGLKIWFNLSNGAAKIGTF